MNTKIALSGISILASLALVGGATFALFTDIATSQNNTFATGNGDLLIAPEGPESPGTYVDDIPAPAIDESDIFPGFTQDYIFWLKNNSSSAISLDLVATFDDVVTTGDAEIANQLNVAFTCQSDTDSNGSFDTTIATAGPFTVNAWDVGSAPLGTLGANDSTDDGEGADEAECTMTVSLPVSADDTIAGSSVRFDGVFDATQATP